MSRQQFSAVVALLVLVAACIVYATYSANRRAADRLAFDKQKEMDRSFQDIFRGNRR